MHKYTQDKAVGYTVFLKDGVEMDPEQIINDLNEASEKATHSGQAEFSGDIVMGTPISRNTAIEMIRNIQNGKFDRYEIKHKIPMGSIAEKMWDQTDFAYGMEYGAIFAIMKIFNLEKSDL